MNTNKKILLLSTSDTGGAGEAMRKLHNVLKQKGYTAALLVKQKTKNSHQIVQYQEKKNIYQRILRKIKNKFLSLNPLQLNLNYYYFSKDEFSRNLDISNTLRLIGFTPDYVFTGFTAGFSNSTDLYNLHKATNAKIYNITVDMNHFTGGCHYAWDCEGYINGCDSNCPAILNPKQKKLAKTNFETKLKNAKAANFQIIAGSGLTLEQAQKSKIYSSQKDYFNVNSLIDINIFNNKNRAFAKHFFNLDQNKLSILCGAQNATEKRKGFEFLIEALKILENRLNKNLLEKIEIIVVSNTKNENFDQLKITTKYIDFVTDNRLLALLYQSSDLFVNCSIEDSGPMMVSEALACGTPVIGFDTGVVTNMVINDHNGYKVENKNSEALADAIQKFMLLSDEKKKEFSENGVKQVEQFSSLKTLESILNKIII